MLKLNTIFKEIKDIPSDRLEELYSYIHTLNPKVKKTDNLRKEILSFAGILAAMNKSEYSDFLKQMKKARAELFSRNITL